MHDNSLEGMRDSHHLHAPAVPDECAPLGSLDLDVSSLDTAYLYAAYAHDWANGTTTANNFADAVALHRMIDHVIETSAEFYG